MADMDFKPVCKELERLLKAQIKKEGLVKSGKLLNSISVDYNNETFNITAEDYYTFLDEKYKISETVLNSDEFISFMENYLAEQIEKQIKD